MNFKECFFAWIFNKTTKNNEVQTNIKSSDQFTLTPSTIEKTVENKDGVQEENKTYQTVKDIANKLLDKDVRNIALTGPFGSGKSSLLLTLQNDFPQYNYLNISLATLQCDKEVKKKEDKSTKLTTVDKEKKIHEPNLHERKESVDSQKKSSQGIEDSLNRLIEYSILQQLIYKEKANSIPQSRFKRIKHISDGQSIRFSIGIVLFVLSCCILFEPRFLHIQTLYDIFTRGKNWKAFWDITSLIYIIIAAIYAIKKLIVITYNSKLNKLNLKDGEIDISENPSIFNKHLDEIIYFFEVTNYDVVIIEDLDRFETPHIFLKLRELNHLLNSSKAIQRADKRKIVFIYAVKDDIFNDISRTKFFDYIATVIPVINPSNSCDILMNALKDHGVKDITDKTCLDLGIFINDMRILKNIVNEFIQYRNKLDTKLDAKKLLAMILYKNYYPKDFAKLHNQDGIVFHAILNKVKYHNSAVQQKDKLIAALQDEQKQILHFYSVQKEKELRTLYVMKYVEKLVYVQEFREGNNRSTLGQIIENSELFRKLENNIFQYYYSNQYGSEILNITFQEIEKEVDPNYTYQQRLGMTPQRISKIGTEIVKLQQEILEYRALPLQGILDKYPAADFYQDVKENLLIAFLLKRGYIDENYYDYISYFYPGTITASDRDFVLNVKIGIKKDYNYKINKTAAVVKQIQDSLFVNGLILNIDLVDFIAVNKELYSKQLIWTINYIKRKNEFSFIEAYYFQAKEQSLFFNEILPRWNEFFTEGVLKRDKNIEDVNFEILLRYFPKSNIERYKDFGFKNYVSKRFDFISAKLDIIHFDNVKFVTESFGIKYNNLQVEGSVSKELMSFIVAGNYYKITNENISIVLYSLKQESAEKFKQASYSAILETGNDNLINYINANINVSIDEVFSEESKFEDEYSLIQIAENDEIKDEIKKKYLLRQTNKISDLSTVAKDCRDIVIETNIVDPTWENIEEYISLDKESELTTSIIDFISKNSIELGQQETNGLISSSTINKLFIQLIGSNILPMESYCNIRKSFNCQFISLEFSTLQPNRMELLIETKGIKFNEFYYTLIDDHFSNFASKFLLQNKFLYLSNITLYPLKPSTATTLFSSLQLTIPEKLSIIETIPTTIFKDNSTLSNLICSILNQAGKLTVDKDFVTGVLRSASDKPQKLLLFLKKCLESSYDKLFVKLGLGLLGGEYATIALQRGHRPKLSVSKENKLLFDYLKRNNFISKYNEEKGMIRVNAKNIG